MEFKLYTNTLQRLVRKVKLNGQSQQTRGIGCLSLLSTH